MLPALTPPLVRGSALLRRFDAVTRLSGCFVFGRHWLAAIMIMDFVTLLAGCLFAGRESFCPASHYCQRLAHSGAAADAVDFARSLDGRASRLESAAVIHTFVAR